LEKPPQIPPPPPQSNKPDIATKKNPFTHGDGDGQVFHFKGLGISYGTDDKGHAASLVLSVLLFVGLIICLGFGTLGNDSKFVLEISKVMGTAFLIVTGIAVGKSIENRKD
jgi:hypothetical protein